jgi:hypothetical protein
MFDPDDCGAGNGREFVGYVSRPCWLDAVDQYRDLYFCGHNGVDDHSKNHKNNKKIEKEKKIWNRRKR